MKKRYDDGFDVLGCWHFQAADDVEHAEEEERRPRQVGRRGVGAPHPGAVRGAHRRRK